MVNLLRLLAPHSRPLVPLCGALALLVAAAVSWSPLAEARRAFRADHSAVWQPAGEVGRDEVLTGLAPPKNGLKPDSPNIILITVDTWRADRLHLYGAETETSPWLDELAEDSLVFERAVAPSSWTWPTVVSIATGVYPERHGVQKPHSALCEEANTLAEVLHAAGWRTGFVGSNEYFEPLLSGYRQGFEYFWSGTEDAARVSEYSRYFLDGASEEPFFLHAHFFDPHCPYDASDMYLNAVRATAGPARGLEPGQSIPDIPVEQALQHLCHVVPPLDRNVQELTVAEWNSSNTVQDYLDYYDAELLETDVALRDFAGLLKRYKDWDNSWIILTGDHGEEFNEHGRVGHGVNLYSETTWVPLIIRPPGGLSGGGRRVKDPVSLVDIAPTLFDAAGLNPAPGLDGWSLMAAVRGEALVPRTVFAETSYEGTEAWWLAERFDRRLLVEESSRRAEMYAADDVMDRNNLLEGKVEGYDQIRAAGLARLLHQERTEQENQPVCQDSIQPLDEEHKEQLRSLGYTTD
jgi:arylsulfatase